MLQELEYPHSDQLAEQRGNLGRGDEIAFLRENVPLRIVPVGGVSQGDLPVLVDLDLAEHVQMLGDGISQGAGLEEELLGLELGEVAVPQQTVGTEGPQCPLNHNYIL